MRRERLFLPLGGYFVFLGSCFDFDGYRTAGEGGHETGSTCVAPVSGPCNTFPQCGCPFGQACDVADPSGSTACYPSQNIQVSSECSALGSCAPGSSCVSGACKTFCRSNSDCSGDAQCFQARWSDVDVPFCTVCSDQCSLSNPNATCEKGLTCVHRSDVGQNPGVSICLATSSTSTTECGEASPNCAPGYVCVKDDESNWACKKWCQIGGSDCTAPQECTRFGPAQTDHVYVGLTPYGFCK
jgi:hypothetical protein